ncbi:DNA alkylation repair protein [Pendulispora albinea]|uniref:DNA alkylation repair protein n=1 Tax=Pendulispora albinea TaxID=2741071 RepID=A0ABZ2M6B7_9BACT
MDPEDAVRFFRARFRAEGDADRARQEKAYLKSTLRFHGVSIPKVRRAAADFARAHTELDRSDLRAIVDALLGTDYHDLRSAGIALLERLRDRLDARDAAWLLACVRQCPGWAHVDWIATKVLGPTVQEHRSMPGLLRAWARDPDFWVRRTALLAQHDALRAGEGDFALFEELAVPMLGEKEFFIRKAIGWVLRETSKKRPELVHAFVARHGERMAGLTRREATKYLSS